MPAVERRDLFDCSVFGSSSSSCSDSSLTGSAFLAPDRRELLAGVDSLGETLLAAAFSEGLRARVERDEVGVLVSTTGSSSFCACEREPLFVAGVLTSGSSCVTGSGFLADRRELVAGVFAGVGTFSAKNEY